MKDDKLNKCIEYIMNYDPYEFMDPSERSHEIVDNQMPHILKVRREVLGNLILLEPKFQTNLIITVLAELNRAAQVNQIKYFREDLSTDDYGSWTDFLRIRNPNEEDEINLYEIFDFVLFLLIEIETVCLIYDIPFTKILQDQNIDLGPAFHYQPKENKPGQKHLSIDPTFRPEAVPTIFKFHKDFFSPDDQVQFMDLLISGSIPNEKLLFRDNSNRLTDSFKKLIEHDFITGCSKKALQEWICQTFMFLQKNVAKPYNIETVERTISGNQNPCMNPLIQIIHGQIVNDPHPRQNKSSNY